MNLTLLEFHYKEMLKCCASQTEGKDTRGNSESTQRHDKYIQNGKYVDKYKRCKGNSQILLLEV